MSAPASFVGVGDRLVVLAVTTYNRCDYLRECLESWAATRNPAYRWLVIVADDGSTDGTPGYLARPGIPADCHVIRNDRRGAGGQTNAIFRLCRRLDYAIGFKIDDDVVFKRRGWDDLYVDAVRRSGYDHLCHLNLPLFNAERRPKQPLVATRPLAVDPSGTCAAYTGVYDCMGCLFTFTPRVLATVGDIDEANFPVRGDWHIDFSARAARAGFNRVDTFFDARGSGGYIDIQNNLKSVYRHTIAPHSAEMRAVSAPAELERRRRIVRDESRIYVAMEKSAG
jgi:glycosyltransferase involved in cell wall biosynthesis